MSLSGVIETDVPGAWTECPVRDDDGKATQALSLGEAFPTGSQPNVGLWRAHPGTYSSDGIPMPELFMVRSGAGTLILQGTLHNLRPGIVCVLPAQVPFRFEITEAFEKIAISCR